MSGLFGLWRTDGRAVESDLLRRMSERLAHRGPDGDGLWSDGAVGLGHRMLRTTPESLVERQPMGLAEGDLMLTADARVDNRDELIRSLDLSGRPADRIADAELILRSYERWGETCLERLVGDYAFAIWDGRRHVLFCARDPMGVRPFYYHHAPGRLFCFASEIKALLCLPDVPRKLDELQVAYHIERIVDDREITFYQGIRRLPAASAMRVSANGVTVWRHWDPDVEREIRLSSDDEYAEAFLDVFTQAVRSRVRSAFPVGSTLSGGLDSSSIACVARNALRERGEALHAFSAVFPGLPEAERKLADESGYIDAVVATGGMESHRIRVDEVGPLDDLDRVLEEQDEAHIVVNLHLHRALFQSAAGAGVRVFLDGTDGDTTVSHGLGRLEDLAATGLWDAFANEVQALSARFQRSPHYYVTRCAQTHLSRLVWRGRLVRWTRAVGTLRRSLDVSYPWLLYRHGFGALAPKALVGAWRTLRGRNRTGPRWIDPRFAQRVAFERHRQALAAERNGSHRYDSRTGHRDALLSPVFQTIFEVHDRAAAPLQLDLRYPFCDRRLMEFCLALPSDQQLREGWTRYVLRRAMEGILPEEIQWRVRKQNLSPTAIRGLRERNADVVRDAVYAEPQPLAGYARMTALQRIFGRFMDDESWRGVNTDHAMSLYQAATLARWLRTEPFAVGSRALDAVHEMHCRSAVLAAN